MTVSLHKEAALALRTMTLLADSDSAAAEEAYDAIDLWLRDLTHIQEWHGRRDAVIQALADILSTWGTPEIWESFKLDLEPTKEDTS